MKQNSEKRPGFCPRLTGQCSQRWWLAQPGRANTPNWDLVSTCSDRRSQGSYPGRGQGARGGALDDQAVPRIEFRADRECARPKQPLLGTHRRQASRCRPTHTIRSGSFRFRLEAGEDGIPVVLFYLGFLDAHEMEAEVELAQRPRPVASLEGSIERDDS